MRTRLWIHFWTALILLIPLGAQAAQDGAINDAGDIAFVAYHDNDDGFSFVLMDDAPNGASIRFVDEEWTGAAFTSPTGEGEVLWTNNTGSDITKGTVIDITDADDNSTGIVASSGIAVEADSGFTVSNGDQIYAITGTRTTPGTFLAFVGESQDINGLETAVLTGTGLTAGTHAKLTATEGYYSGSTSCVSNLTACLQQINNAAWIGAAGFSYPSVIPNTFSGTVFVSDATPPVANVITHDGSAASSATSVIFTVVFDENANNMSADDFSVTTVSGSATGSVASLPASSGSAVNVTVNSITGVGTIRLDLKSSTNITDDTGNGNGTNGSVAAFTTGATHSVSMLDADASLTASATVTEPVAINTTVIASGSAVDVFDFTLTDGGTADGQALSVSQIVLNVTGTASHANRAKVTWRLNGADASNVTGSYNAGANTITFSSLSISVANNTSEVYTVNAFYNTNTGLTDGLTYILSVDGDTDLTVGGSGTQMASSTPIDNSTGSTVDVVATTMDFTTAPAGLVSGIATTTQPVVAAVDAFNNIDKDFSENVTLIFAPGSPTPGSVSGNLVAAVNGVATFTSFAFIATQDGQGMVAQANDVDGVGSNLSTDNTLLLNVDVVATKLVFDTQPAPLTVDSGVAKSFTTMPVLSAKDAGDVVDTGYSTAVTLSEVNGAGAATMTGTGDTDGDGATVTLNMTFGQATFTGLALTYTVAGAAAENFNIQASSGALDTADSNQITAAPADSDGDLIASANVSEPVALGTTQASSGSAVDLFDFTLADGGSADGLAMTVSQVVLHVTGTASDAERAKVTWRLNGADASNVVGSYNAGADTITFSSLSISVADGGSEDYTINAFYNTNTGLTDGLTYILSVDGDTDLTVGGSGTQMASTTPIENSTGSTVDVVATTLAFTTQPAGSVSGSALTTQPVVTARDAFGNTDTDFSETVTLTEASAGSLSNTTAIASSGVATFSNLIYFASADQESMTITANDQDGVGTDLSTVNASAVTSDVVATVLAFTTQPAGSVSGSALTTQPVVTARDANGIQDTGFTETITLSEASAGSIVNNTAISVSGVATFSGLAYTATADQQSFFLFAEDQAGVGSDLPTTSANPVTSDVVATKLVFDTQPAPLSVISGDATAMTTVPVISARDANNLLDTGYSTSITLAEINGAGAVTMTGYLDTDGSGSTVTITPTAGVSTFNRLMIDYVVSGASAENFNLQASSGGLSTSNSSQLLANADIISPHLGNIFRKAPVSSPTNADSLTWTFAFNEIVINLDATDFEVTGTTATVQSINQVTPGVYDVTISSGDLANFNGTATLSIASGHNLTDRAGNALTNRVPKNQNVNTFVVDNSAPTLSLSAPSATSTSNGPITYMLTYSNADTITLANSNITLIKTGTANGTAAVSGSGNTSRTVTISAITGDGTLGISVAANTASDNTGHNATAANSATFTVAPNQASTLNISGNTVVGETLVASLADTDGLTGVTITYQWTSGSNNVGINSSSYTLQASDVGKTIRINAQYTDLRGTAENINSAATAAIITLQTDAVNRISSTANQAGGTEPTVDDYKTAGITDVSDTVLTRILPLINSAVARQSDSADVDDVSKLQALVDAILEGQDNDEDGLPNMVEGTVDTDNDGTTDREDTDSDNDGVADQLEVRLTLTDSDSDGIIDVLDADVGNDGEVDTDKVDANFDGVDDALDSMVELIAKSKLHSQASPPINTETQQSFSQFNQDQDLRPNHLDLDSDNDGVLDVVESGLSDTNGDGKLDTDDVVITDGSKLLDGDADSVPNMLELKSDGISFDLSVNGLPDTLDTDANGILDSTIDMDRDGIIDSIDNAVGAQGTLPDVDGDGIPNHADDDDDGDGILDVNENPQQQYFTGKDADADGIDDGVDQNVNGVLAGEDLNNNGVRDDRELSDADNDGIADHLDADSGGDGTQDNQSTAVNTGPDVKSGGAGAMNIMMMLSLLLLSALRYPRNVLRISIALLLGLSATISHAQNWQVNLGLGQSSLQPDLASGLETGDGRDKAIQLGLGYRITSDLLVELRYSDLGDTDIHRSQGRSTLGYKAWVLDTKYQLPLLQGTAWSPYVLGGIAINRLQSDDLSLEKKTDSGVMLGAGISYRFQKFQLNSELIRYSDDIAGWFMGIQKDF